MKEISWMVYTPFPCSRAQTAIKFVLVQSLTLKAVDASSSYYIEELLKFVPYKPFGFCLDLLVLVSPYLKAFIINIGVGFPSSEYSEGVK